MLPAAGEKCSLAQCCQTLWVAEIRRHCQGPGVTGWGLADTHRGGNTGQPESSRDKSESGQGSPGEMEDPEQIVADMLLPA